MTPYDASIHFTTAGVVDTYTLQNAPVWMSIHPTTGIITGQGSVVGELTENITVTGTNTFGIAISNTFSMEVVRGHTYWRLYISANNGLANWHSIHELKFMASSGGAQLAVGGTALALTEYDGTYPVEHVFDGVLTTRWVSQNGSGDIPCWVQYEFLEPTAVLYFSIYTEESTYLGAVPKDFCLRYSDNGIDWIDAKCVTGEINWTQYEEREFVVA